ncbi:MAG: RNA polymerase factor sigma-54 [Bacteroidales bacterium]|nr:RNA polymerase factor sigma-54 [Bacteroidales bacterium]MBR5532924.1 RNA polymerase factor sigma-54 [Bacteroidales bacterium]
MALKQQLEQKLQQRLSPQQIQIIRLMELTNLELEERIKQEIIDNPALDEISIGSDGEENSLSKEEDIVLNDEGGNNEDLSLGDYFSEDDIPDYKILQYEKANNENYRGDIPFVGGSSIQEHLLEQLGLIELTDIEEKVAEYIIGNIDDDGYLRRPLQSISDDLIFQVGIDIDVTGIEHILNKIREFDPAGIGATSLQECLMLQLERIENSDESIDVAKKVISNYFDAFSKKHYDKIGKTLGLNGEVLKRVIKTLTQLNPRPGSAWNSSYADTGNQIIPDFIIEDNDGELSFTMNNSNIPELKVSQKYIDMFEDYNNKANQTKDRHDALLFVKQKLDAAQWFINAVKQRQTTLSKIMTALISLQREFLLTGDEHYLRPMILKDIAEVTEFDISTVSRVVNGKYMQTRYGIYPLKHLFSESMLTSEGEEVSSKEIKKILIEIVENEDKRRPLSDDALCEILCKKGYKIARRTVAKYREQADIPVARLRKEL